MRYFFASLKPAVVAFALLTLFLGIVYPLFIFGIGQLFFPKNANGSLLFKDNKVVGSALIAQGFNRPEYFHPRPSSAGKNGYDAADSSGSNLGPTSQKLFDALQQRANEYRAENNLSVCAAIPADAVMASGSGLDPHISVANALLQMPRVASARHMSEERLRDLIAEYTEGEARVNVLRINLALTTL